MQTGARGDRSIRANGSRRHDQRAIRVGGFAGAAPAIAAFAECSRISGAASEIFRPRLFHVHTTVLVACGSDDDRAMAAGVVQRGLQRAVSEAELAVDVVVGPRLPLPNMLPVKAH